MDDFVMAPAGAYHVVISVEQGGEAQAKRIESWPVIAFDRQGVPLLMDGKQLAPVSEIVDRYQTPDWHLDGGAPHVYVEWGA
ncbi:MAG TPA: hypothetical protein VE983_06220 [Solirubrobacteraceae bacterium]|nr:hypothetical protein [Solirubrobacteraceae bacterium]